MAQRVPQITDDVVLRLMLPGTTEEWAEELLEDVDSVEQIDRTDDYLSIDARVRGNCNALVNARMFLQEVEDALTEGQIDPMHFTLNAVSEEPTK